MITPLVQVAVATAALTVALVLLSRWWRRDDAHGWHLIGSMLAAGALCAVPVAAAVPLPQLVVRTVVWSPPAVATGVIGPVLGSIYAAGLLVLLGRLALGVIKVRRLVAHADRLSASDHDRLVELIGNDAGRCRVHADLAVPVAAAGTILLPASWSTWSPTRLHVVLLHERAHLNRRDVWWTMLAAVHQAVYWPSPAAWWLSRVIRRQAEHACDQAAASVVGAAPCARVLVETARDLTAKDAPVPQLALGAHEDLTARVDALLEAPASRARLSSGALVAVIVVMLTALTAAAQQGAPTSPFADQEAFGARHAERHAGH